MSDRVFIRTMQGIFVVLFIAILLSIGWRLDRLEHQARRCLELHQASDAKCSLRMRSATMQAVSEALAAVKRAEAEDI